MSEPDTTREADATDGDGDVELRAVGRLSWTTKQAAYRLGLTEQQLRKLIRAGHIHAVRKGTKGYLVPETALVAYLKDAESDAA